MYVFVGPCAGLTAAVKKHRVKIVKNFLAILISF